MINYISSAFGLLVSPRHEFSQSAIKREIRLRDKKFRAMILQKKLNYHQIRDCTRESFGASARTRKLSTGVTRFATECA